MSLLLYLLGSSQLLNFSSNLHPLCGTRPLQSTQPSSSACNHLWSRLEGTVSGPSPKSSCSPNQTSFATLPGQHLNWRWTALERTFLSPIVLGQPGYLFLYFDKLTIRNHLPFRCTFWRKFRDLQAFWRLRCRPLSWSEFPAPSKLLCLRVESQDKLLSAESRQHRRRKSLLRKYPWKPEWNQLTLCLQTTPPALWYSSRDPYKFLKTVVRFSYLSQLLWPLPFGQLLL